MRTNNEHRMTTYLSGGQDQGAAEVLPDCDGCSDTPRPAVDTAALPLCQTENQTPSLLGVKINYKFYYLPTNIVKVCMRQTLNVF